MPGVTDDKLVQLLTTVFFAGLETYEGEYYPIGVVFLGRSTVDFVMSEDASAAPLLLYRWKILRFTSPRPFSARELVKLAVTGADRRIYTAVAVLDDGRLGITGLAREGLNAGLDPFVKVIASRPGCLTIRSGRELVVEYERGTILTAGNGKAFSAESVHRALTAIAHSADVNDTVIPHYLDAVDFLVREILAHGRGGILIISAEERPSVGESAPYRMALDSSLAGLLRLAWRIEPWQESEPPASRALERQIEPSAAVSADRPHPAFGRLLRNAFLTEAERVVEELGRLTAIDGAVLLNRELALVAFGVILPVGQMIAVEEATRAHNGRSISVDLGSRGTRHRAGATYAAEHPGSVVFVASEDGQLSCMLCEASGAPVRLRRLTGETARILP